MILSDGQAYFCVSLEPSILVHEDNIWRFEGVLKGENDGAMIYSLMKLCILRALDGEMPCVDVIRQGGCVKIAEFFLA